MTDQPRVKATGKEMHQLIETGTCPQCGGALSNTNRLDEDFVIGGCDTCNVNWAGTRHGVEANLRWATMK